MPGGVSLKCEAIISRRFAGVLDKNSSSYGQTVRDPVLVDLDKDGSVRDLRDEFPYKRGELRVELKDGS